eukprot:TRINITY_DN25432_c0_g1_i1.p1 TRINITY_DN25432_c0_g1~~TRINITY_DN25432_c0_g1_i1.p1  ORF type:complete len:498 (-),score=89.41 TRINITY_DN25432_c0_g1_i1:25-1518(-)
MMSSPASYSPGSAHSPNSPRISMGMSSSSSRALAVVTNRWYREQRRADQDATRTLTLLKQRKISCILKVESLQRGIGRDAEGVPEVERELEEVERKMSDLERDREERCRKIMDRRVQQVTTLQELGLLEAAGKDARWRSESDLKEGDGQCQRSSPALSGYSPSLMARYSPGASSSSSHASRKLTPPLLGARFRAGSDPSIARPDPSGRLEPGLEEKPSKGLAAKLSPRLGRRNPLRMLSNAIDFRSRRKQRPKSADFETVDDTDAGSSNQSSTRLPVTPRSASVTDILESVSLSPGPGPNPTALPPRVLEGRNSAPDMLPGRTGEHRDTRNTRNRSRLSAAASAKQKLSTRFQPQRKQQHRVIQASSSVKRAKTFSLGGPGPGIVQTNYKTLPKQASSRSLGSSSTDSSQGSQSTASSRKSSNSSNLSDCSAGSANRAEISQTALEEIAAFEKFIEEYFESCDNNNIPNKPGKPIAAKMKHKLSASSVLSEVLELSI